MREQERESHLDALARRLASGGMSRRDALRVGGCPSGMTACGGACVDLMTDFNNCGACGTKCCNYFANSSCVNGTCQINSCSPTGSTAAATRVTAAIASAQTVRPQRARRQSAANSRALSVCARLGRVGVLVWRREESRPPIARVATDEKPQKSVGLGCARA